MMDFAYTEKTKKLIVQLEDFMDKYIYPHAEQWDKEVNAGIYPVSFIDDLKQLARDEGLWNLFLPGLQADEPGTRLTNLEYAPLAEIMGKVSWASEVFNCNAPDTGNMELLHMFASEQQREQWLRPLMDGKIRSAFAMTEPDVSSSDATNIQTLITRDGDNYVINGRKWFITNAAHPLCEFFIVMGRTDPNAEPHRQQSMVIVPKNTPGVNILRNITIINHHSPEGHCEILFENVKVPVENLLDEEGQGFALAQARLGPGRIHHCMRSIGSAELALDLMIMRSQERKTFGKFLYEHGALEEWISLSRIEIDQARLLVLNAAWMIDKLGTKAARKEISMIKVAVPRMLTIVVDRAMQTFGAMGASPDTPLPDMWVNGRTLRYIDGPDEVHIRSISRQERRAKRSVNDIHRFLYDRNASLT